MYGLAPYGTIPYGSPVEERAPDLSPDLITAVTSVEMTGFNAVVDVVSRARGRTAYGAIIKPWRLGDR
jgi:hypothetical protein